MQGEERRLLVTVDLIPGTGQSIVSLQDITEQKFLEKELRNREQRYRMMADNISDVIWTSDMDLRYTYVSPSVIKVFGYTDEETVGRSVLNNLTLQSRKTVERLFKKTKRMELQRHPDRFKSTTFELEHKHKDGHRVWSEQRIVILRDSNDRPVGILGVARDISERKEMELAIQKSEAKYRELVQNANSIIMRRDLDGRILFFNEYAQRFFDYSENEIIGKNVVGTIMPAIDSQGLNLAEMMNDIVTHTDRYILNEHENVRKNGERVWIAWTNKAICNEEGIVSEILCIGNDITQRKIVEEALRQSREELRMLSNRLLTIQEDERKKVAHDIHDSIGQTLSSLKYGIETTTNLIKTDRHSGFEKLESLVPMIQQSIKEVRKISADLWPASLESLGLVKLISSTCNDFASLFPHIALQRNITVTEEKIPHSLKIIIYRIVQESLNNVAKHSGASRAVLSLRKNRGKIRLSIKDNGRGFDRITSNRVEEDYHKEWGLSIMKERTYLSGGTFSIRSKKESGTEVRASWPCDDSPSINRHSEKMRPVSSD